MTRKNNDPWADKCVADVYRLEHFDDGSPTCYTMVKLFLEKYFEGEERNE